MNFILENLITDYRFQVLISSLVAMYITWRAVPVIISICQLRNLMENPIKRSSHHTPTPTFGGVAIFAGTMVGYMLWNFEDEGILIHKVFAGLVILFFLGIKDDLFAIAPLKKLGTQVLASTLVVMGSDLRINSFFGIFGIFEIPYFVSIAFTIFLFVALINSINLIDGIDGLAGGIGMIASGILGLWFLENENWSLAALGLSLSASLLGFLRFNYSKTNKIFMGDTGSLITGYLITILAVKFVVINQNYNFSPGNHFVSAPVLAIVLLNIPIFDTLRVFAIRIIKRKSPFKADRLHLHHLLIDNGLSHKAASFTLYAETILLTFFTYYLRSFFSNTALSVYLLCVFALYLTFGQYLEYRRFKLVKAKSSSMINGLSKTSESILEGSINPN